MELVLGTAQFGMNYGVTNRGGQVCDVVVKKMLDVAKASNIRSLDTAISYGNSESVLGKAGIDEFVIITKLPSMSGLAGSVDKLVDSMVANSLERLKRNRIDVLLLHDERDLLGEHGHSLSSAVQRLRHCGLVERIGVSIYGPGNLSKITKMMPLDVVQAPMNVLDKRLETSGWLTKLNNHGVEVHCRSPFLQGLLLAPRAEIPSRFNRWANIWDEWEQASGGLKEVKVKLCIDALKAVSGVTKIVVGAQSESELLELVSAVSKSGTQYAVDFSRFGLADEDLLDPFRWKFL